MGYRMVRPMNGNLNLVQSFVEQLSGDSDLISLRSRASLDRPFTRLKEMEAKAGREWESQAQGTGGQASPRPSAKSANCNRAKSGNEQQFILSPEQQKELENYQKTVADANKELKIDAQEIAQGHRLAGILDQSRQHRRHAGAGGRDRHRPGRCANANAPPQNESQTIDPSFGGPGRYRRGGSGAAQSQSGILDRIRKRRSDRSSCKNFQVNDVAAIHIKGDTDLTLVKRTTAGACRNASDYPANFSADQGTAHQNGRFENRPVRADRPLAIGAHAPGRAGQGRRFGHLLEFKDAQGKALESLLLGKKHTHKSDRPSPMPFGDEGFADGRYVMLQERSERQS